MLRAQLRSGLAHVGLALREPEEFARRWHERRGPVFLVGLRRAGADGDPRHNHLWSDDGAAGRSARRSSWTPCCCTAAAGLAWGIALPSLYIFNSLSGSRLRASTTLLAALVTTSWGGLAMIASIPINWFFTVALADLVADPSRVTWLVRVVNLVVFTGVGVSMIDIFGRVMEVLEPERGRWPVLWLAVVAAIGGELFYAFGLFEFAVRI